MLYVLRGRTHNDYNINAPRGERGFRNLLGLCADGEVADLLPTCWQQVVVMEFGKRHDTTDTTDFYPCQLVTDLSFMLRTCYGLVSDTTGKSPTCYGLAMGKLV